MVPISGTHVPVPSNNMRQQYAASISKALNAELGQSARATKTIMRWTGASERAAKYWLAGSKAPSGWQLILLARNSDAVLHEFLQLCGRDLYEISLELNAAETSLARATAILQALRPRVR
ncbi:MAG: hypothetical protein K0M60_10230 [Hydrogenophaga sp.]|nr:hypothetical protein [Hydrogenophaga sp.]